MTSESHEILNEVVASNFIMTLGTIVDDNPHLCTVYYVTEDNRTLYFKSRTASEHINALDNSDFVAMSMYLPDSDYASRKAGVQAQGKVERVKNPVEMANVLKMYASAFIGSEKKFESIPDMISDAVKSTMFKYTIEKVKLVDSDKGVHFQDYEQV